MLPPILRRPHPAAKPFPSATDRILPISVNGDFGERVLPAQRAGLLLF
jgi:hypothetical protein